MAKYIITKEEVMKQAPIQWNKISKYLRLGVSWTDFLKRMEYVAQKEKRKFVGFDIGVDVHDPHWRARLLKPRKQKWIYAFIGFLPAAKSKYQVEQVLSHELFHLYQSLYLCIDYPDKLMDAFKEACAEVVSIRTVSSKEYQNKYPKKYYYNNSLIMALADQMKDLDRNELIELVTFPKTRKNLKPLTKKIVELLSKTDHAKWIKKIEKDFKKEGRQWWEVIR